MFETGNRSICIFMLLAMIGFSSVCLAETATESDKTSKEKLKQETKDLLQALKAYTADQRDEAIQKSKATLEKLDKRINDLEVKVDKNWDKMDKTARDEARASLKAIRDQRTKVAEWYGRLKGSSADAWGHVKKGFSDAYSELQEAWNKSENKINADNKNDPKK